MCVALPARMFTTSKSVSTRLVWISAPLWLASLPVAACGGSGGVDTAPTTVTAPAASTTTPTTTSGGTTDDNSFARHHQDIKPILDSDCIVCHGSRIHENNDCASKSDQIRAWVVNNNAAESR